MQLEFHHHRSPRWLNARLRLAGFTIPQWIAVLCGGAIGLGVFWLLSQVVHAPRALAGWALFGECVTGGIIGGVLAVVFYALADDRREPVIRQALGYPLRRHTYRYDPTPTEEEDSHALVSPRSLRAWLRTRLASTLARDPDSTTPAA